MNLRGTLKTYRCVSGAKHRGQRIVTATYRKDDKGWVIEGVECCILRLVKGGPFWIGPAHNADEDLIDDIGPFSDRLITVMVATLMEEK